ncbi:acyl-CoA thioesterase [Sneathiella glossodoripedis]|uniref:acyl-CoA thioesterase n=1 Tax=Sneathiella glossodoripedis TaxID=418853 RepID=UPI0004716744|nr:thioesterase family protein [Sneathiella glossodoripedis]
MAQFVMKQKVLFQHCDPAGIVFYPRYFEMVNAVVESWFEEELDLSFAQLHFEHNLAVPTVSIKTDFRAPSRLGEMLSLTLDVQKLGGSSLNLKVKALCREEIRFEADVTLVCVSKQEIKPTRWPQGVRETVEKLVKETP